MRFARLLAAAAALLLAGPACALDPAKAPSPTFNVVTLGTLNLSGIGTLNLDHAGEHSPGTTNVIMGVAGNGVSFCPELSCVTSPTVDHQRASLLVAATTQDDGHSEEQTVAILTRINKGAYKAWAPNTAFALGDNVNMQDGRNAVYRVTKAGTSASSGIGPTGKGSAITDGSVVWSWINDAAINAKVGLYNEVAVVAGGGNSWAQANNFHLRPGSTPSFNVNTEFDFHNDSGKDCFPGVANCNNLYVATSGANKSTASIAVLSPNTSNYAAFWGIRLSGSRLASDQDIAIDSDAAVGIGIGVTGFTQNSHSSAAIQDNSTTPSTLVATGTKTNATINDTATAPTSLSVTGPKSLADIYLAASSPTAIQIDGTRTSAGITDASRSPTSINITGIKAIAGIREASTSATGILLNGSYSANQIAGAGWGVTPSGKIISTRFQMTPGAPSSSSAPCVAGEFVADGSYFYSCVATNTWRRAALSSW